MNSTDIFTSKGDDFDNLVLSLDPFPQLCIIFVIHFHKFGHLKRFFLVGFKSKQPSEKLRMISLPEAREFVYYLCPRIYCPTPGSPNHLEPPVSNL
jgi:hypothetical protein